MADEIDGFSTMLRNALADAVDRTAMGFVDMLAEDAIMEFPFAPAGLPRHLHGRAAIADYLGDLSSLLAFDRIGTPVVHHTLDSAVTILEFDGSGRGVESGRAYDQRYVSVIRTSEGRIVHYRDYWNPLAILAALKEPALMGSLTMEGMVGG